MYSKVRYISGFFCYIELKYDIINLLISIKGEDLDMKIFVGCSSSNNIPEKYLNDSKMCLNDLFACGYDLVFGACNNGIMGIAYNCALKNGGQVTGICPELFKDDFKNLNCTTEILTSSISERTDKMIEEADVLLFLPGGYGTIYELWTAIESKRSHEFDKPIIIYNFNNFFDEMLRFSEKMVRENFVSSSDSSVYCVFDSPEDVVSYIKNLNKRYMI